MSQYSNHARYGLSLGDHRHLAEMALGRELSHLEVVHHVNGCQADNRPENLEVLSHKTHVRLHTLKYWTADERRARDRARWLVYYWGHLEHERKRNREYKRRRRAQCR